MKVLILSVTAGEGHNSTAKALKAGLEEHGVFCTLEDTFLKVNSALYKIMSKGYLLASEDFKLLYGGFYRLAEARKRNAFLPSPTRLMYRNISRKIYRLIQETDPDVILYTHVFSGILLDVIKQRVPLRAKTVGIVTDFVMHPYWEEVLRSDHIVVANEMLVPSAVRKGFNRTQVLPLGIPIHPKFGKSIDKEEARAKIGILPNTPTILLMSGSMGYGKITKTIKELDLLPLDFQMIVVCGNNKKIKADIDALRLSKNLLCLGYVDNVDLLMDAADCLISKPGGLTTSEALAKGLPMIICNPIPGQEERNTEFLQNMGAAMAVSGTYALTDAIHQFFSSKELIKCLHHSINLIAKPNALEDICQKIFSLSDEEKQKDKPVIF